MTRPTPPTEDHITQLGIFSCTTKDTRQSLQGLRTALELRHLVPVPFEAYSAVLRVVKIWAHKRCVYGNNYCYPTGVGLAIMVARICQFYPASTPSILLRVFFKFYSVWLSNHGAIKPIFLTSVLKPPFATRKIPGLYDSWDTKPDTLLNDLLPVLNPAYPYSNACINVGRSGLEAFYNEITRAEQMLKSTSSTTPFQSWTRLWEPYRIGDAFDRFLVVELPAVAHADVHKPSSSASGWDTWALLVESKLKILLYSLEAVAEVRMWPRRLSVAPRGGGRAWAIGLGSMRTCSGGGGVVSGSSVHNNKHPAVGSACDTSNGIVTSEAIARAVKEFRFAVLLDQNRSALASLHPASAVSKDPLALMSALHPVCFLLSSSDPFAPPELQSSSRAKRCRE